MIPMTKRISSKVNPPLKQVRAGPDSLFLDLEFRGRLREREREEFWHKILTYYFNK
jgi:hypothetical protein